MVNGYEWLITANGGRYVATCQDSPSRIIDNDAKRLITRIHAQSFEMRALAICEFDRWFLC